MPLASVGELLLISALLWTVSRLLPWWRLHETATRVWEELHGWQAPTITQRHFVLLLIVALLTVAITASLGAIRFALSDAAGNLNANWQGLVVWHDAMSLLSRQGAMPAYVLSALWLWGRVPKTLVLTLAAISQLPLLGAPALLTDGVLLIGLLRLAQFAQPRPLFIGAVLCLLTVPLCRLFIADQHIAMGVFHLLLALHFAGFSHTLPRHTASDQ